MKVQESFDKRDSLGNKPFFFGSVNFFCGGEKNIWFFPKKSNLIKFDQIWFFWFSQEKKISIVFFWRDEYQEIKLLKSSSIDPWGLDWYWFWQWKNSCETSLLSKEGWCIWSFFRTVPPKKTFESSTSSRSTFGWKKNLRNPSQQKNLKVIHPPKNNSVDLFVSHPLHSQKKSDKLQAFCWLDLV